MHIQEHTRGLLAGIAAFFIWGILPLFWRLLEGTPAMEILSYRIISSAIFLPLLLLCLGRTTEMKQAAVSRKTLLRIIYSTLLIGADWYLFIWAINAGYVLETSLGYYINPLMTVALGIFFLREQAGPLQRLALIFACGGVGWAVVSAGTLPWIALLLALTFALYSFIRKTVQVEALPGLCLESLLLVPFALAWVVYLTVNGEGFLCRPNMREGMLLFVSGPLTSLPLALFTYAARRMRLMTLGVLQYIAPTGVFFIGIFILNEQLTKTDAIMFACVWLALFIYTFDAWKQTVCREKGHTPRRIIRDSLIK